MMSFPAAEIGGVSYIAFGNIRVFAYEFVNMGICVIYSLSWHVNVYDGISSSLDLKLENLNT